MTEQLRRRTFFARPGPGEWVQWSFKGTWIPEQYHTRTKWEAVMYWLRDAVPVECTSAAEVQQWLMAMGMALRDLHVANEIEDDEPIPRKAPEYFRRSDLQFHLDEPVLLAICSQAYPLTSRSVQAAADIFPGTLKTGVGEANTGQTTVVPALLGNNGGSPKAIAANEDGLPQSSPTVARVVGKKGKPPGIPFGEPRPETRRGRQPYVLISDVPWARSNKSSHPREGAGAGIEDGDGDGGIQVGSISAGKAAGVGAEGMGSSAGMRVEGLDAGMQIEGAVAAMQPSKKKGKSAAPPSQSMPPRRSTRPHKPRAPRG